MDNLNLNKHISGQFNAELESIRTQVMTMGGMVEQQLSDAITAMHNQDSELAKRVIEGDKNVNMMEVAIDEACVRIPTGWRLHVAASNTSAQRFYERYGLERGATDFHPTSGRERIAYHWSPSRPPWRIG